MLVLEHGVLTSACTRLSLLCAVRILRLLLARLFEARRSLSSWLEASSSEASSLGQACLPSGGSSSRPLLLASWSSSICADSIAVHHWPVWAGTWGWRGDAWEREVIEWAEQVREHNRLPVTTTTISGQQSVQEDNSHKCMRRRGLADSRAWPQQSTPLQSMRCATCNKTRPPRARRARSFEGVHAWMVRPYDGFYPRASRVKHVILHTEHG